MATQGNLAARGLAKLVREEYGDKYTLAEIAATWGDCTPEEIEAIAAFEKSEATFTFIGCRFVPEAKSDCSIAG